MSKFPKPSCRNTLCRLGTLVMAMLQIVVTLAGCDRQSPLPQANKKPPLLVIASIYAIGDLAKQVGGKYVEVEWVIETGQSLSRFEATPELRGRLNQADLVIAGGGTEPWAILGGENPFAPERFLRMDTLMRGPEALQSGLVWLDPQVAVRTCDEFARRCSIKRPAHEVYFQSQADRAKQQIEQITADYTKRFERLSRRRVLALSYEFDPLAARFGVELIHTVTATNELIGDSQIRQLRAASLDEHVTTLITRADMPPALVQDLAQRSGLRVIALDAYGSSSATGRSSYQELLRYNLDQLLDAAAGGK